MREMQKLESLAEIVGFSVEELCQIYDDTSSDVHELVVWNPAKPLKPRPVILVDGRLRRIQERLHGRMKCEFTPSVYSHGAVSGRDIISMVTPHTKNRFGFKVDITAFYPSISADRVYQFFHHELHCGHQVAKFLTRFCTYDFHLALGLVTSPILADQILKSLDYRLGCLSRIYNLILTRYIDDIMVSANYNILNSVVPGKILEILTQEHFRSNPEKCRDGRLDDKDFAITGLRVRNGRVDVKREFLIELARIIADHRSLAKGGPFNGPYLTESQLAGKVNHVCWVAPRRRFSMRREFNSIRWGDVQREAELRNLVSERKIVQRRDVPPPHFAQRLMEERSVLNHDDDLRGGVVGSGGLRKAPYSE